MISDVLFDMIDDIEKSKEPIVEILMTTLNGICLYKSDYTKYDQVKIEEVYNLIKEKIESEDTNLNDLVEHSNNLAQYLSMDEDD